ncbi:MAG: N-acetylmuramic acid 6-phosphate etherase [Acidobacteria bacterium]|nr:N-acetylmuramic acid 6-phosphate etherase [Acidobacteriota bacterium]
MEGASARNRAPVKRAVRRKPPSSLGIKTSRRTLRISSPSITERRIAASRELDAGDTVSILRLIQEQDALVPGAVKAQLQNIVRAVDAAVKAVRRGGRIFYIGAGTSGRLGVLDAAECPPTFGVSSKTVQAVIAGGPRALVRAAETAEDDREQGRRDLVKSKVGPRDIVIGLTASGGTPYTVGALEYARSRRAATVAITSAPGSPITRAARIAIVPATGPEVLAGSTRLKAALAQKMVLHMISTTVMVRLGHVYKNYMVGVRPTNRKLRERACTILMELTGADEKAVRFTLQQSGNDVKVAFVMLRRGLDRRAAVRLLSRHGGNLRAIV